LCPTTCKVRQNHNFFLHMNNLINLLNCKQEIRRPRLFLSDNDDSVVLSNRLRPAPPIDFITYAAAPDSHLLRTARLHHTSTHRT
jgi:hypothetical protein